MSVQLMVQLSVQLTREPSLLTVVGRVSGGTMIGVPTMPYKTMIPCWLWTLYHGTMLTMNAVPWYHGDDGYASHPAPPVTTDWQENSWRKVAKHWRRVQPITLMVQQILTWSIRRPPLLEHKKDQMMSKSTNGCCVKGLGSAKLLGLFEIWGWMGGGTVEKSALHGTIYNCIWDQRHRLWPLACV